MKIECSFSWDPAKEFLKIAEEFLKYNNQDRYQAMVILVMSAGIEAKIKEPFYKILPEAFEEVSNAEFYPLLYALFLMNKKNDISKKLSEIKKTYRSDMENPEFIDFKKPIQILIQLRNQIAHGKIIVQKSTILPKLAPPLFSKNKDSKINTRFLKILDYIYETNEYKNLSIMERKRPVFNIPDIEVIFEPAIVKHFYKEVLQFYNFIDENLDIWAELNDKQE